MRWMHNEILCLLHFCRPGFLTIHIPPCSSMGSQVLRTCRSQRLEMGLKRVSWARRYQGQCRALQPLGHQGYRLRSYKKDPPLCSGYTWPACPDRAACRGGGGGPSPGGVACHRCEGRRVSGAVPPPAVSPLGRVAGVPRPVCPGCGWCGRGDPAPVPQRAPFQTGVAHCGSGGGASLRGLPSTVMRGV